MRAPRGRFWLGTGLLAAGFLAGSWLAPRVRIVWEPGPLPTVARAQAGPAAEGARGRLPADEPVARAVQIASPSVVNIDTVKRLVREEWFFGPQVYETRGNGSGVVVDARGYVVTNEHVVAGAEEIVVTFGNGRKSRGRVIGADRETDVGVIRLTDPPPALPVAKLGDPTRLLPGQWAIAIGNPYGYQQTVTLGVIGHVGRAVRMPDRVYKRLIQTDAAINPGNSGGALVDIQGNVVGINTIVRADAQGIGFAIPIDLAKGVADELIRVGKIKRPWAGMIVENMTPDVAEYLGLPRPEGVYVQQLDRRGPAWAAGIRTGDVVRELAGRKVASRAEVDAILSQARIGQRLEIVVEREGQRMRGEIVIAEKP